AYYRKRGKPTVFQIDDGWERDIGDWEPDPVKFPHGMKALAEAVEDRGLIPGLWLAPLLATRTSSLAAEHPDWLLRDEAGRPLVAGWNPGWDGRFFCLDLSLAAVEEHLAELFHHVVEDWGYRYIKLDFLYAGFLRGARRGGGAAFEQYDRIMRRLTALTMDSRGRSVAYLGCGAPFEPSFRHFPLMRIGADTRESWERPTLRLAGYPGRPAARVNLSHTLGRSLFDGTIFVSDPDVMFCRRVGMRLSENEKELIALVDFMLASQIMVSDGAEDADDPGAAAFTARIVALFDRLAGRRYGAERIGRDLYRLFSEDGTVSGIANLSARARPGPDLDRLRPIVSHAFRAGRALHFEPHTISLYEE
ncbi:MAG: alpha-galactosidase, partial [Treponema sp.]|nr:alpha-galactosidase [Treponema sp.]